eukprot:CAMPEP_0179367720 /NCGR_PEP_ID=MMETSP0797-20121207/83719_1 /TAXON_ID=47934 /ORGANISM="Dinophysis acuminata, Strain DAEP01" /LENGTH=55 /DNA_ID=CAMNT_0021083277 /DNA_START=887 /DNA_END=1051 /DNA_ORIENTATION=-
MCRDSHADIEAEEIDSSSGMCAPLSAENAHAVLARSCGDNTASFGMAAADVDCSS